MSLPDDWTPEQSDTFTRVYRFMVSNQSAMNHPGAPPLSVEHWQTVCHNAAFLSAEMVVDCDLRVIDTDTEQVIAQSPQGLNS